MRCTLSKIAKDHPYHPDKWPGCDVHPVSGLAIGPVVWQEPRLHHHLGVDPHHVVRCGCGRREVASMMRDVRHLPKGKRARSYHHDEDWTCTGCADTANWLGLWYDDDHHRALGAPDHIAALSTPHMDHIRAHREALAFRDHVDAEMVNREAPSTDRHKIALELLNANPGKWSRVETGLREGISRAEAKSACV